VGRREGGGRERVERRRSSYHGGKRRGSVIVSKSEGESGLLERELGTGRGGRKRFIGWMVGGVIWE